jgi:hypothetical protein
MNPGEYLSPFPRKTFVMCPVVSGYVTARLQDSSWFRPTVSGPMTAMRVLFENVGGTAFSVVLNETDDHSTSGTRYRMSGFSGSAAYLVPGGQQNLTVSGYRPIVEVFCTGTTNGVLRMQIESQRQFVELGFNKDDAFYPPRLFQAKEIPGPLS